MDENRTEDRLRKLRIAAVTGLAVIAAALAVREVIRHDRTEIEKHTSMPDSSSQYIEPSDIEKIDLDAMLEEFAYAEVTADTADRTLLSIGGYDAPRSRLQPVYNALFAADGTQVASLADTKLMCAAEAVYPLAHMLEDFYIETGKRTVMVSSAYAAPPEPEYDHGGYGYGYGYEPEITEPDETASGLLIGFELYEEYSGSREFTGEGIYGWFVDNCYKYGFVVRYPEGKESVTGHEKDLTRFRYVGSEAALIMHENSLCLEELESFIAGLSFNNGLLREIGGRPELIYAISADENGYAQIRLPADPEGTPAPFRAYSCGSCYLICAEPQYTPLIEDAVTETASDSGDTSTEEE